MADKSTVREAFNALVAENWSSKVVDTLFNKMPMMKVLFGKNGTKKGAYGIGIPDSGALVSGMSGAKIRKEEILSALIYQPIIKHLTTDESDGKVMGMEDNMPVKAGWENKGPEKRFKRPSFRWFDIADPAKVSNERIRHTRRSSKGERNGWEAIGSLLRVERDDVAANHVKRLNDLLWGVYTGTRCPTNGRPSDEDAEKYDAPFSFAESCKADNSYGGVDRSLASNAFFRGNYITAATAANFRDMIRAANYSMVLPDGTVGLQAKTEVPPVFFVGGALMNVALQEADAKQGLIIRAGQPIPEFGEFGFMRDSVRIDNTYIIYDPTCPAKHVFGMSPDTWTMAIHPDANFKQSAPTDQSDNEGGDDATTWTLRTKLLIANEAPMFNVYWTNVA